MTIAVGIDLSIFASSTVYFANIAMFLETINPVSLSLSIQPLCVNCFIYGMAHILRNLLKYINNLKRLYFNCCP